MYEHVTSFVDDIERLGFDEAGRLGNELTHAMYLPDIVDKHYRDTLDSYGLEGVRPWSADIESLDVKATLAMLTWVHRADHFAEGTMARCLEDGFVYRILLRLRELDEGITRPTQIGFWRETELFGCLSNWYPAGFDFCDTWFATSEHWMMCQKACLMGDMEKAGQILAAPTPRKAKELGAEVEPYDDALWNAVREQLVYYGIREKCIANERVRNLLLSTGPALLAEASPYDKVWGAGVTADDPRFANPAEWKGKNLLGRACMRARSDVRQLVELGRLAAVSHEWPELDPSIARLTLLQLSRIPVARSAVYCYATIVSHAAPETYPSADAFLQHEEGTAIKYLAQIMQARLDDGLSVTGWFELVRALEIQHVLGRL